MISHYVLSNFHSIKLCLKRGSLHHLKQMLKPQKALVAMGLEIKSFKRNQRPDYIELN